VSIRPVQSQSRSGAFAVLLAAASLLSGALALSPSPAAAATDQGDKCASLPEIWEQLACEEEHGGSGSGNSGGSGQSSQGAETGDAGSQGDGQSQNDEQGKAKAYPPEPTYTHDDFFDDVFTEEGMNKLRRSLRNCDRVWRSTRRVTHIHPYRFSAWVDHDPNDAEVNRELRDDWRNYHCSLVYDLLAHP
jgi:hypothetical protein